MQETATILRVIGHKANEGYIFVCVEADIVVLGQSIDEAKEKMLDAVSLYLKSFTPEQVRSGEYIRKAPLKYLLYWEIASFVQRFRRLKDSFSKRVVFDPTNSRALFA